MAKSLTAETLRTLLKDRNQILQSPFTILRGISTFVNNESQEETGRELVLRALEYRDAFGDCGEILESLTRSVGLFPYIIKDRLNLADAIAYEYHRPLESQEDIVFHREQAYVYRRLLSGDSVILSAPTSFGKSKIIDAMIARNVYNNIAVVVPTIALIDETRRRLSCFSDKYKIITHLIQEPGDRNLFILTPERVVAYEDLPQIDFFVIDEFYKLGAMEEDTERTVALNNAFYRLLKQRGQFYLLGPNIEKIPSSVEGKLSCYFHTTNFSTVVAEQKYVGVPSDKEQKLIEICDELYEPTLIFCKSPKSVNDIANLLLDNDVTWSSPDLKCAAEWIGANYHQDWIFGKGLVQGIGIHHGKLPRSLSQYVVRKFNDLQLKFLICTSTLIEGVNTKAKNVIIYDHQIARKNIDYFTFNNIRGRSGRMFEHFIGNAYLFEHPPQEELPFVDIPILTQSDGVPESLLVQMDEDDLEDKSKERIEKYVSGQILSIAVIRKNFGIEPEDQIQLAKEISNNPQPELLGWQQFPKYNQLKHACKLIWDHFVVRAKNGVYSSEQLTYKINQLKQRKSAKERILDELTPGQYAAQTPDEAVERILQFDRSWAGFDFPRYLMALSNIQAEVLSKRKLRYGDYSYFSYQVECLFESSVLIALEEYGVPMILGKKIDDKIGLSDNLDEALAQLKRVDIEEIASDEFEQEVLTDTLQYI